MQAEPSSPLLLAIVGCGTVAQVNYARTLPRVSYIRPAFVSDLREEAARTLGRALNAEVASVSEITDKADAVIIATPPSTHYELVKTCLQRVPIVVCEKPFVPTAREARELVEIAAERQHRLLVGHFRRTFAGLRLARDIIDTGILGSLTAIDAAEGGRFAWEAESGYVFRDPYGGVLFDTGSHTVDMALFATRLDQQSFEVAVREVVRDRPEPAHEIRAVLQLTTITGPVELKLHLSRYRALANRVRLTFERGVLDVPVSPRGSIRMTGAAGSAILTAPGAQNDYDAAFVDQWRAMFASVEKSADFQAERFVGLSAILETIAATALVK